MRFYALHKKYVDENYFYREECESLFDDRSYDEIINHYKSKSKCLDDKKTLEEKRDKEKSKFTQCACCPIHDLTKRKYNNNPKKISGYCANYNIYYEGNSISCTFSYPYTISMDEKYYIEEINTID